MTDRDDLDLANFKTISLDGVPLGGVTKLAFSYSADLSPTEVTMTFHVRKGGIKINDDEIDICPQYRNQKPEGAKA